MGVEDWESKYKVPDSGVLDDYLDAEQKMWEDEDKSIIYKISDSPSESRVSRFYQTVECDAHFPEDLLELDGRTHRRRRAFGSGEVRLVYKEAGSFEDESSPPEIDIIPSAKQLRQLSDRESLLFKTRLWAKTALEDTLENYAAFREEEAAREEAERIRERGEYNSVGSDEMQYSFGSEEELDDLTFTEGDTCYEYESYYYPGKYMPPYGEDFSSKGRSSHGQDPMLSLVKEPGEEYIDPMDELKSLVHSVSEYLAVKEEEISNYESMPKPVRRKLPALPTDAKVVQPKESSNDDVKADIKEDSAVEQGIAGVKNAMSSLFSTITGSKPATEGDATGTTSSPQPTQADSGISKLLSLIPKANNEVTETSGATATEPPTSQSSPQPESGISKLLSFIPKSGGTSPPVAIVPPASQEPTSEKKFSLQSLLPFQSSESNQQADASQTATLSTDSQGSGSKQATSGFESMLGRLSPLRLFSSAPPSRDPSPQPSEQRSASAPINDSQQGPVNKTVSTIREGSQTDRQLSGEMRTGSGSGSVDFLSDTGSGSIELFQETGSGSVELLPETESSGELPDVQQRKSTPVPEPKPESSSEEAGFFSPFKKSLSSLMSTTPPESSQQSDTKSADESFLGTKLKLPFFSENISATTAPPKAEGGMLSGILKFASGEDASATPKSPTPSPTRTPSPSRAALLESLPKGNTETGWFSNLFKVTPNEPAKEPMKQQMTPTVILTKPTDQTEQIVSDITEGTVCKTEPLCQEQMSSEKDSQSKPDVQSESTATSKNQSPPKSVEQDESQPEASQTQGFLSGLLKLGSTDSDSSVMKIEGGNTQPQQGGLFSGLFSPPSQSSPQTQQTSATQQSGGLLSGFLKFASDVSASTNQSSSTLPGGQSSQISTPKQEQPTSAQPSSVGLLSGILKKATDTVSGSQPNLASHELEPEVADHKAKMEGSDQNLSQGMTPTQSAGILSGGTPSDPQLKQPAASDQKPSEQTDQTPPKPPPTETGTTPQPSGLFGGLLKFPETGSQQEHPPQQGGFLSGLFGMGAQDSAPANQTQHSQNQSRTVKPGNQPIQQPTNRQNLQRQNQLPPQQPPSSPAGMLSGLFSKITDAATPQSTVGSQPEQQQAQRPGPNITQQASSQQGGFFSGLFSTGPTPPPQQQPPVSRNQQQPQQGNRQPLRRQNQIPQQSAASAPELQQGGLLSGLFNKLAASDNAPQQPTPQTASQQGNKSNLAGPSQPVGQQSSQTGQQGGFLSGLFSQTSPQQQQQQQSGKTGSQQTGTQQPSQSGGLLSGFLKLASGDSAPQEQPSPQPVQGGQPSDKPGQTPAQSESGGLFSGILNKISGTVEQSPPPPADQKIQEPKQPHTGQGRPQIQRTKPVEMHSSQDVGDKDKDLKSTSQKGFLKSLFSATEESPSKTQQPSTPQLGKEEQKTSASSRSPSLLSSILKTGTNDSTSAPGKENEKGCFDHLLPKSKVDIHSSTATLTSGSPVTSTVETCKEATHSQGLQDPTISPTRRYLEEIQRLLYGTADEYGYKDLLYNFTEHGVIPPDLYEHQCLIEALLWQQLNDYILAESLATQVQEGYQTYQGHMAPTVRPPQWENQTCLKPKEMDISGFNVPSHPWRDSAAQLFESRNRFLEPGEDVILFDMSCRDNKSWSSCDQLNNLAGNAKPWIVRGSALNLSTEKTKTQLSRCQSLTECRGQEFSKMVEETTVSHLKDKDFDLKSATEFLKQLATKKGPMDLRRGALDLSRSAGITGDAEEQMLFKDSEWYQQWLLLLEQGLWWPAEAGDCGYYVYTDEDYIYSLLTDKAGKHLYACATPEDVQALGNITENIAKILKQKERDKVTLCGFKIPFYTENEGFWIQGDQQNGLVLSDAPVNLTSALKKGEKIMNMNLESFSQMFQESLSSQAEQPVDFSVYKLKKINVESLQNTHDHQEEPIEAADMTLKSLKGGHGGPYWKNQAIADVNTTSSAHSPRYRSTQIFPNRHSQIPEIRIAPAEDVLAEPPRQKSSSIVSAAGEAVKRPSKTDTSKTGIQSSTPATSPPVSNKVSETSRILSGSPSAQKIPGPVHSGRKLPTPPAVSTGVSSAASPSQAVSIKISSTTSTSTVPSVSPQRHRLARQPSQAERPRVLSQPNQMTVTGMSSISNVNSSLATDESASLSQNQPQKSSQQLTPQLHILNDSSDTYSEAYLYNRNRTSLLTTASSQICNKVIDCSATTKQIKNVKQKGATDDSVKSAQRIEVVDFTKYKLKRFKEKQSIDTQANTDLTGQTTIAVDLTKQTEEDEVEWPDSEYGTMNTLQQSPTCSQTDHRLADPHKKSERRLSRPEVTTSHVTSVVHIQKLPGSQSTHIMTETNCTKVEADNSPKPSSTSKLSESSHSSVSSSVTDVSSKASGLNSGLKQTAKMKSAQPVCTSPLLSPIFRKQVATQEPQPNCSVGVGLQMQQSPQISTTPPYQSNGTAEQYQKNTSPANSIKPTLDMSKKKTTQQTQQTVVPTVPICEALPLTKRKTLPSEKTDKSLSCHESIDLSNKAEFQEPTEQTIEYTNSVPVEKKLPLTVGMIQIRSSNTKEETSCGDRRISLPRQRPLLGQFTESLETGKTLCQATAPANAVKATLDMTSKSSAKFKEAHLEVGTNDTLSEALPLTRSKPSAHEFVRNNSVGIPLVVDNPSEVPLGNLRSSNANAQQTAMSKLQNHSGSILCQQPWHRKSEAFLHSNQITSQLSVITQMKSPATSPANSIKSTIDMSTKTGKSDAMVNYSDPVSLVRIRPSGFSYSQGDSVGVPLIVETHLSQIQTKRQPTVAGSQVPIQQGYVQSGCQEISAPANSIKSYLDMSPKPQEKWSETVPDTLSTGVVPLIKNKANMIRNGSVGVPLIVTQSANQQGRQVLSRISKTETLHTNIFPYQCNDVFSGPNAISKDMWQQNKPVNFSAKDSLKPSALSNQIEPKAEEPMNFSNVKAKKEMFERRKTERPLERETPDGIVNLTVDLQNKITVVRDQNTKDLSSSYISSQSQNGIYCHQPYTPAASTEDIREDTQKPLQYREYLPDKNSTIQPGINSRWQLGTGINSESMTTSVLSLVPVQMKTQPPQAIEEPKRSSLNNAYQQISCANVDYKKHDPLSQQQQTQHSAVQQQYQHSGAKTGWTPAIVTSQPIPLKVERHDPSVQFDILSRPKILIKQATVDSYESTEEILPNSETVSSNGHALPSASTHQLYGTIQNDPTTHNVHNLSLSQQPDGRPRPEPSPQSSGMQPVQSMATEDFSKGPLELSKHSSQYQTPVTYKQYSTPTVPLKVSTSVSQPFTKCDPVPVQPLQSNFPNQNFGAELQQPEASVTGSLELSKQSTQTQTHVTVQQYSTPTESLNISTSISQQSTKCDPVRAQPLKSSFPNQDFGAQLQQPEVSVTAARSTSVKGLISLFSGAGSQPSASTMPAAAPSHQLMSTTEDQRTQFTGTQMTADIKQTTPPVTPAGLQEKTALSSQSLIVSSSLPVTDQANFGSRLTSENNDISNRKEITYPVTQTKSFEDSRSVVVKDKVTSSFSSESTKDQSAALQTELDPTQSLISKSEHRNNDSILSDISSETSPVILPMVSNISELPVHGLPSSLSQEYQQPPPMLNAIPEKEKQDKERPFPEKVLTKPSDTMPPKGILSFDSSAEPSQTPSEVTSEAGGKEGSVITDKMFVPESDISMHEILEHSKQTVATESSDGNTECGENSLSNGSQDKSQHQKSIYIGIGSEIPETQIEPGDQKPYIRLPHIFVSAASSPEEETNEHEFSECSTPEIPEASVSKETAPDAECKDSLPDYSVSESEISKEARATEICSTELSTELEQIKTSSPEMPLILTAESSTLAERDSQHIMTEKCSTTDDVLSRAEGISESTEANEPQTELTSKDAKLSVPDNTTLDVVEQLGDLAGQVGNTTSVIKSSNAPETLDALANKRESTSSEIVLSEGVQSHENVSPEELPSVSDAKLPEKVQPLYDETQKDVSLSEPKPSPVKPLTEEIIVSKEDSSAGKVDQPEDEQAGKGLFSLFSGSTPNSQQTSSPGISLLGGILPGSSAKDAPGTGLLSMFGGSSTPSSPGSKETTPTPQEPQGKGLFSMFGGASSQASPAPRGPTVGSVRPRGPPPKEPPGKGLFSMFGSSAPQQPPSPRGQPMGSATPRAPSTGSSIFGGILPGSTTNKETPGAGLFSKIGGLGAQSQTSPRVRPPGPTVTPPRPSSSEITGKGLFSMFGGQSQQASEAQLPVSKPPESEGFKVSSVFSLGGSSDSNKSKTGFGLFGMSFLEETKPEQETTAFVKEEIVSELVKPPDTKDNLEEGKNDHVEKIKSVSPEPLSVSSDKEEIASEQVKPQGTKDDSEQERSDCVENKKIISPELLSTSSIRMESQIEQACQDVKDSTADIDQNVTKMSVPSTDRDIENKTTIQQKLPFDENASDTVKASNVDTHVTTSKETLVEAEKQVCQAESEIEKENKEIKDSVDVERKFAESELDSLIDESKSTGDEAETADIKSLSEKNDTMQMALQVSSESTDKNPSSNKVEDKAVTNAELAISEIEKPSEELLKVADADEASVTGIEKTSEEALKVAAEKKTVVADVEKLTEEPLKVDSFEQKAVLEIEESTEHTSEDASEENTVKAVIEKLTSELEKVADEQKVMTDEEKSTEHTNVVDSVVQKPETVTAESVVTAVSDFEKAVQEDSKIASSETIKEITEAKLEHAITEPGDKVCESTPLADFIVSPDVTLKELTEAELEHATTEPAEKVSESSPLAGVASSTNEERTIGTNSIPPLAPSTPPPQQQPRPGMTRPLGPQVQRMGVPRMGGPRMGAPRMSGPRMAGPRQPGPQKPPEPAPFSGFMSMFSAPNTQSKSPTVGGFFSSSAASLFGSSPAPRQPPPQQQQQQQQQKSSFFGLPSSIASESLTSDLLGMFKGPEATKPEETQQSGTQCGPDELSASVTDCAITEKPEIPLSEDGHVKSTESEIPEKGLVEETEQKETEAEGNSPTESIIQTTEKQSGDDEHVEHSEGPVTAVSDKAAPPTAPENKGIFEIPGLTAPKLGFLSVAAEGTSSIGSLFSTSTSPATASKAPQTQQTDGGLFSGFKSLSAGIFHDEKSTGKEEASVSSVFGMKLTSMFGNSDSPRPESTPPVVSVEPQSETPKPTECEDPEPDKPSPGSGETESEDGSDTEGPTETSKTGSCDSLAQSPLSGVRSHSVSQIESLDTPQLMVTPCELDKSEVNAPDVVHAELEMDQPKEQLTKEAMKRLVQCT